MHSCIDTYTHICITLLPLLTSYCCSFSLTLIAPVLKDTEVFFLTDPGAGSLGTYVGVAAAAAADCVNNGAADGDGGEVDVADVADGADGADVSAIRPSLLRFFCVTRLTRGLLLLSFLLLWLLLMLLMLLLLLLLLP